MGGALWLKRWVVAQGHTGKEGWSVLAVQAQSGPLEMKSTKPFSYFITKCVMEERGNNLFSVLLNKYLLFYTPVDFHVYESRSRLLRMLGLF